MAWGQCRTFIDLLLPQATSWVKPHTWPPRLPLRPNLPFIPGPHLFPYNSACRGWLQDAAVKGVRSQLCQGGSLKVESAIHLGPVRSLA